MKTKSYIGGKLIVDFDYTDCVNELIEDGEFETLEEIRDYVKSCVAEDILNDTDISQLINWTKVTIRR